MLVDAAILLAMAGLLGLVLVALHARGAAPSTPSRAPRWWVGALHGALGGAGFILLLLALAAPRRAAGDGTALFGMDAAALLGAALAIGVGLVIGRLRRQPISMLVLGLHATFAIMGLVVLAAFL
jgi:hypothetical protein